MLTLCINDAHGRDGMRFGEPDCAISDLDLEAVGDLLRARIAEATSDGTSAYLYRALNHKGGAR